MSPLVLITTAIEPPEGMPHLKLTNVAARHLTTKAAVFFWAAQGIEKIVLADATGKAPLSREETGMLKKMNVEVEQISYRQDEALVRRKGKGYGEGALIGFSLANSRLLRDTENFFKCTGKVYCRNLKAIFQMIENNKLQHIFWRHLEPGDVRMWADLRFFYTTKDFCEHYLVPAYLRSDDEEQATESTCFHVLEETLPEAATLRPLLSGFCGGTGELYFDSSLGVLDAHFPCWASVQR